MAQLMKVTVKHDDGEQATYTVLPKTIVAFERTFGVGLGATGQTGRMEYVYWLAWDSEKCSGKVVKPFDDWLAGVLSVDVDEDSAPLVGDSSPPS